MNAIEKAIDAVGGVSQLASRLPGNVSPQRVCNWRVRGVPAEVCPDIERATGGAVTCEDLRPDLAEQWAYLRNSRNQEATRAA